MDELAQSLNEAIGKAHDRIADLSPHQRKSAVLATELLEKSMSYIIAEGGGESEEGFQKPAIDVLIALGSVLTSLAMTSAQGDIDESKETVDRWIDNIRKSCFRMIERQGENAIFVSSQD